MAGGMKSLAKDTAIYGVSSILGKVLNWLLVPMYVRVFAGTGEFGVYSNAFAWVALLLVILTYGMETGFFRFINKKEEKEPMRVYATTLFSLAVTSVLFVVVTYIFIDPISRLLQYEAYPDYLKMLFLIVGLDAFCSIPFAFLRYQGRPVRFMAIRLTNIGLNIGLNLFFFLACPVIWETMPEAISWFYNPGYGVGYAFVANVITSIVTLLLLIPSMRPAFTSKPNIPLLRQMLRYSFPILILGIAGIFNQTADKIVFRFLFDDTQYADEQLGIYSACFKIAVIMVMFIQAFRYAYEPFIFAKNKEKGDLKVYSEAMKYFIIFGVFIFLGVMYYLDIVKLVFLTPEYYPGLKVVPIVMAGEFFFGIYFNLSLWYKLTDQTHWGAWFSLAGCIVTLLIIVVFAPVYGFMACAWASFCCNLLIMLISYFVGQKKYPIAYDLRSAALYVGIGVLLFAAGMAIQCEPVWLRLGLRTLLLVLYIGIALRRDISWHDLPFAGKYFKR
ncbi:oligosaccharide flippase family protein [Parabacteroides sp. OttesenSCG-928-G06]|nr:oligosaccharide flippase family protein [Parabacteroides sp. OttesenSCG-928-G06]